MKIFALIIGLIVGFFLVVGSSIIIKKMMVIIQDKSTGPWSPGQAIGLASLWTTKLVAACLALYFAQRYGFSTKLLGIGLLPGLALGVFVIQLKTQK